MSIVIGTIHCSVTGEIGVPGEKGFKGSKGEMVNNMVIKYTIFLNAQRTLVYNQFYVLISEYEKTCIQNM